jgi:phospholipid/cholesterol/gamma-HCH transport system permease protein
MVVSNEVDAFVAIGINPIRYLVVPRVLGVTISSMALGIYFSAAGLLASFFVVQLFQPLPFAEYGLGLMAAITPSAIVTALVKQLAFGVIIGVTATLHGLLVGQSSTEIPRRVISAVGQSLFLTIAVNVLITVASYAFE